MNNIVKIILSVISYVTLTISSLAGSGSNKAIVTAKHINIPQRNSIEVELKNNTADKLKFSDYLYSNSDVDYSKIQQYVYSNYKDIKKDVRFKTIDGTYIAIRSLPYALESKPITSICSNISRALSGEDIDISSIDFNRSMGYTYIEINSVSNYMSIFVDNEIKYSGKCRVGSNIPKGIYVVNEMLENTNISANNYVSRYIGFDNTFFISDASWEILGEYNEDCISVPVKDIRRASYWAFINMPIIIY